MQFRKSIFILTVCFVLVCGTDAFAGSVPDTGDLGEPACNPHSYTDLGNGIIKDTVTGLMWQQATAQGVYTWDQANTHCASLTLGGYSGWRLPTIKELSTLIDSSIPPLGPTIYTAYFSDTGQTYYWSSTVSAEDSERAWGVHFDYSVVSSSPKTLSYSVRAVRGESPANSFIDNADGTITDTSTGLMWEKATSASMYTWEDAKAYCENLILAGQSDWRLPTRNELQTLVDYNSYDPAISTTFFPDTQASYYWTSTNDADSDGMWYVYFANGLVANNCKTNALYVRAVRAGQCSTVSTSTTTTVSGGTSTTTTVGCPVQQMLGQNSPNLEQLWDFRDNKLAQSTLGRKIIHIYYNNADDINKALEERPVLKECTRKTLDIFTLVLERKLK